MSRSTIGVAALAAALFSAPGAALACACGCGVFDVGSGTFMPSTASSGFTGWLTYNFMNQNQNWEGARAGPAADNTDKRIRTEFITLGGEYTFNPDWTLAVNLPLYDRFFTSTDDGTVAGPAGGLYSAHLFAMGDLQVMATYSGFVKDQTSGLSFGLKLPTGLYSSPVGPLGGPEFDRDTLPGTGSTDLLLGGYHLGYFDVAHRFSWFVQARYDIAFATRDAYRPGNELDAAAGVSYDLGQTGPFADVSVFAQMLDSWRLHDTGANADPLNSGYERVLVGPGISLTLRRVTFTGNVSIPVYQHTNAAASPSVEGTAGQLVAPELLTLQASYNF
ncbi:MAG: hypothetical protein KGL69_08150 [Alphaproteobacteria bacterium]|nr:hypothetical protein [Alphaproteobacteria bacterium]